MTVIAYRGGIMAADRLSSSQWLKHGRGTKVSRIQNHLVGCAGPAGQNFIWRAWFAAGAVAADYPWAQIDKGDATHALVVSPDRKIAFYAYGPYPAIAENEWYAIGSGQEVAVAVMYLGHSAERAVEVAIELCAGCGGGVDLVTL